MSEKSLKLTEILHEIASLLTVYGESFWARKVKGATSPLNPDLLLSFFGGMGSLNDLYFVKEDADATVDNERFRELLETAYQLAGDLSSRD